MKTSNTSIEDFKYFNLRLQLLQDRQTDSSVYRVAPQLKITVESMLGGCRVYGVSGHSLVKVGVEAELDNMQFMKLFEIKCSVNKVSSLKIRLKIDV